MFTLKHENSYGRLFSILFFACIAIEVTAEMFSSKLLIYIFKPLISIGCAFTVAGSSAKLKAKHRNHRVIFIEKLLIKN